MGIKIPSTTTATNSANSIINTDRIGESSWIDTVDLGEVKAGIVTLWANMSNRINQAVPYGMTGLVVGMIAIPLAVYLTYRAITAATHYLRKPAAPLLEKPLVEKPLVEKPLVEKPLVEKPLVEKPLVEKPRAPRANQVASTPVSSSVPTGLPPSKPIKDFMLNFSQQVQSIIDKLDQKITLTNDNKYKRDPTEKINTKPKQFYEEHLKGIVSELAKLEDSIKKADKNTPNVEKITVLIQEAVKMLTAKNVSMKQMAIVRSISEGTKEMLTTANQLLNEGLQAASAKAKEARSQKAEPSKAEKTPLAQGLEEKKKGSASSTGIVKELSPSDKDELNAQMLLVEEEWKKNLAMRAGGKAAFSQPSVK